MQKVDTLFHRKMLFLFIKEFWTAFQVKHFLKEWIKFSYFSFFFIVEPLREPFPYSKTDFNQNFHTILAKWTYDNIFA